MLHQELLLAQLPTGRQGSKVSFIMTQLWTIYTRKMQALGQLLVLCQQYSLIFWSLQAVAVVVVASVVVVELVGCFLFLVKP
jgi:hypothetical protein